ncbi:FlgD immunoglobulin-like domain containing protein [Candidatus Eisenbacteria bacterium]|uniref:FlgD immunoglobulin-like domain containing protein n=1 Tax=Eiseniibacteriota bacterium TaxID=2212470 RepID=A0ABV6YLV2_UNCEI
MNRRTFSRFSKATQLGPLLLALMLFLPKARADEPVLAILLTGWDCEIYNLPEVERITLDGGDRLVVVTGDGSDSYATESIMKIWFFPDHHSVEDSEETAALTTAIHLFQNRPNPFSPETQISFDLPQEGAMELRIYNPAGRLVRTLVSGERPAGRHSFNWDGLDDAERGAASGVYFYSLRAPGIGESRRMILLP